MTATRRRAPAGFPSFRWVLRGARIEAASHGGQIMRAIWTTGTKGPDSLEVRETADPEPEPGQVRVRVRAAGLCFAEVMAAQGLYPGAPKFPAVLGYEAAGVIDQVGEDVDERREGSHVITLVRY